MIDAGKYPLLSKIDSPSDLRMIGTDMIPGLCSEIREFLVDNVSVTGGHLASNLGVVELTLALHRVFNTPEDRIVFDVGHQSYVHKIITGRKDRFDTLRQPGGLSGFTRREESVYDAFGAGHSSTSLSAAIGLAEADKLAGRQNFTIAVLGDGAYTGGMVHEALNNIDPSLKLIVVLNENEMSIGRNIGGFASYIAKIRASAGYGATKSRTRRFLTSIPLIGNGLYSFLKGIKKFFKNLIYSSNYFEELGLFYMGPIDGNDYKALEKVLTAAKNKGESTIVHIKTVKGKGYEPAEKNPLMYHGIPPRQCAVPDTTFSFEFGRMLCEMAERNVRIAAISAAMTESVGLAPFEEKFPDRFFDVGIAEAHAATFAAGLAAAGMKPFFAVYSSFLQRAYDSVIHDIALQRLPVVFCIDRASLSSGDGPTHHGIYDVSIFNAAGNIEIIAPHDYVSLNAALERAEKSEIPTAIRYHNGDELKYRDRFGLDGSLEPAADFPEDAVLDAVVVTYGKAVEEAVRAEEAAASEDIRIGTVLLQKINPYSAVSEKIARMIPDGCPAVIYLEEGIITGGAAEATFREMRERGLCDGKKLEILAIRNGFVRGDPGKTIRESAGVSASDIIRLVKGFK